MKKQKIVCFILKLESQLSFGKRPTQIILDTRTGHLRPEEPVCKYTATSTLNIVEHKPGSGSASSPAARSGACRQSRLAGQQLLHDVAGGRLKPPYGQPRSLHGWQLPSLHRDAPRVSVDIGEVSETLAAGSRRTAAHPSTLLLRQDALLYFMTRQGKIERFQFRTNYSLTELAA